MESSVDAGSVPASNGPDGPGQLVGLPYHYVVGPAFEQRLQPRACGCFVAFEHNRSCCMHQQRSQIYVPTFADAHCRTRPLVQLGRGTNPTQAENSLASVNVWADNCGCGEQAEARYLSML